MDIVYVVREGDRNPELRYSLRSIAANLPHDQVWIVGYCPKWVDPASVQHLRTMQAFGKFRVVPSNMVAACRDARISDPFILMHDDMFVVRPTREVPIVHRGPVAEEIDKGSWAKVYVQGMQRAVSLLGAWGRPDPVSYELHMPMVVHKGGFLEMWKRAAFTVRDLNIPSCSRTLYGNCMFGTGHPRVADAKVRDMQSVPADDATFVSTSDREFGKGKVGEWVRARFPEPCRYESA